MVSLETTELKLRTTPTGGVSSEHSPYYRRLLSAGYKGYIQGTLGGAGYYGMLGLAIGALVGIPAFFMTGGSAALLLIPAMAGAGALKGADTFGNIGSTAAINAEGADLSEQRRYLLDRYYDLPEGPEGDAQAAIIKQELADQYKTNNHHQFFHWKTVAICAAIGGALALAFLSPIGAALLTHGPLATVFHSAGLAHMSAGVLGTIGTAIGALAGATIGIDRHYIRSWFDGSEKLLYDEDQSREALRERAQQVARLKLAAVEDKRTELLVRRNEQMFPPPSPPAPILQTADKPLLSAPVMQQHQSPIDESVKPNSIAMLNASEKPSTEISSAVREQRVRELQEALDIPAL